MSRLIWLIVILGALWSGWWWIATNGLQNALTTLSAQQNAQGRQLAWSDLKTTGYPFAIRAEARDVALSDPAGVSVALDEISLTTPTYWPGDISVELPATPMELALPQGKFLIRASDAKADAYLKPGPSLTLQTATLISRDWQLNSPQGNMMTGSALDASLRQDADDPNQYHVDLRIPDLTPGDLLRMPLQLDASWPMTLTDTQAQVSLTFQTPLDRYSADHPPQVHQIALHQVALAWGPASLQADGNLHLDASGTPDGLIRLQVQGWPVLLDIAVNAGFVRADRRVQAETMLRALSNMGGDDRTLDLTLSFENGQMALGPIALGPAPRLINR